MTTTKVERAGESLGCCGISVETCLGSTVGYLMALARLLFIWRGLHRFQCSRETLWRDLLIAIFWSNYLLRRKNLATLLGWGIFFPLLPNLCTYTQVLYRSTHVRFHFCVFKLIVSIDASWVAVIGYRLGEREPQKEASVLPRPVFTLLREMLRMFSTIARLTIWSTFHNHSLPVCNITYRARHDIGS